MDLKVLSFDDSYVVNMPEVFSINDIPVRPNLIPSKMQVNENAKFM